MSEILFSNEIMQYINMASGILQVDILDCLQADNRLIFIVKKGQLGAAIGSKGKNLERLRTLFKKQIKFVEFDDDKQRFVHNLCKPYKIKTVTLEGNDDALVAKITVETSDKSKLIGRDGRNIDIIRTLAQRHHAIKDVQIK